MAKIFSIAFFIHAPMRLQVLPDLSEGKWTFNGTSEIPRGAYEGLEADTYVWPLTEDYGYGKVAASYVFYVGQVRTYLLLGNAVDQHPLSSSNAHFISTLRRQPFSLHL